MSQPREFMSLASPETATAFVSGIDLAVAPAAPVAGDGGARFALRAPFDAVLSPPAEPRTRPEPAAGADVEAIGARANVQQAFLVGSQIVSFNDEVTAARRAAVVNSSLLAQLRASKLHPDRSSPARARAWHAAYVNTLSNIGWVIQGGREVENRVGERGAEVDKVVLDIAGAVLGGGAAAVLAATVLEALRKLDDGDPFITLYNSRTVQHRTVEFGFSLATGAGQGFLLNAIEYALHVSVEREHVLFFKWDSTDAHFRYRGFELSLNDDVFESVRADIAAKLKGPAKDFVRQITI